MERQYNLRSPAVKRLMREAQELREPTEIFYAQPLEDNLFEWHFTIRGPVETDFDGGVYHGRIILPPEYPMKPPSIILLTPNGRFELFKKICLSISGHHPESWQPSWSIRTALLAIIGFMPTHGSGAIGALDYTTEERKILAKKSREWKCPDCGFVRDSLKPLTEASKSDCQEAKELASQINFQAEKQNGGASSESSASAQSAQEPAESATQASGASETGSSSSASPSASAGASAGASAAASAVAPSASPGGAATNFPFPPPFNPAMMGARMPMMPGFMPPMMPQFPGMPGMSNPAANQMPFPQIPHPLVAAQMARMNPFWPMMNPAFQNQSQASGQRSFQQMFEMMRSMQQQANPPSIGATSQPRMSASNTNQTSSSPQPATTTVPTSTVSGSPTPSESATSATTSSASPNASSPADPAPAANLAAPTSASESQPQASQSSSSVPTTASTSDTELRHRGPPASPPNPSDANRPHVNRPSPPYFNPVNQGYTSAELPTTRTRSENPFVVFLILVLGLAIVALILRRVYKFNLWNYEY